MEIIELKDIKEFEKIRNNDAVLFYFSHERCNVCKVLKPNIFKQLQIKYPKFQMIYIDIEKVPEISGQLGIFTVPTIVINFEGKEFYRLSRNIGVEELMQKIERPYSLFFE